MGGVRIGVRWGLEVTGCGDVDLSWTGYNSKGTFQERDFYRDE
jgi:hypothetical protein